MQSNFSFAIACCIVLMGSVMQTSSKWGTFFIHALRIHEKYEAWQIFKRYYSILKNLNYFPHFFKFNSFACTMTVTAQARTSLRTRAIIWLDKLTERRRAVLYSRRRLRRNGKQFLSSREPLRGGASRTPAIQL